MSQAVRIDGLKELNEKLLTLEPKLQRKTLGKALREAGKPVLAESKRLVAVDTGTLRDALKLRSKGPSRKRPHRQSVSVATPTRKALKMAADEKGYYPAVVEYGAAGRNIPARPYLRPALSNKQNEALNALKTELAKGVVKAATT
jgi:HK97 gp10 family phage protein